MTGAALTHGRRTKIKRSRSMAGGLVLAIALTLVTTTHARASAPRIRDGAYRANVTAASLEARGVDAGDARGNSGVQTLIFRGSRWTNTTTKGARHEPACSGNLTYADGWVTLTADCGPQCGTAAGGLLFRARWTFAHDQLRFLAVQARGSDPVPQALFGGRPWTKIA
jgi:hypothetical protein